MCVCVRECVCVSVHMCVCVSICVKRGFGFSGMEDDQPSDQSFASASCQVILGSLVLNVCWPLASDLGWFMAN